MVDATYVTALGTVTEHHLTYRARRTWLDDGSVRSIPLMEITSARRDTTRRPILGIVLVVATLSIQAAFPGIGTLIGVVPLAMAVWWLWGSPVVRLRTADGEIEPVQGPPWTSSEADWLTVQLSQPQRAHVTAP